MEVEVKHIDTYKGEQNTPEYLKINPLHQVPVYHDDDFTLTESRAIICYLASSAKSKLYPTDLKKRALVDSRLYFDATNCFPVVRDFAVSLFKRQECKALNFYSSVPSCVLELRKSPKIGEKP